MKRREFLGVAALPLAQALNRGPIAASRARVVGVDGTNVTGVDLLRSWSGPFCRARLINRTSRAIPIREVSLFDVELRMPAGTLLYGEGFQMLSQTGGTLAAPADFSQYTDAKHYRLSEPGGGRAFYGLVTLTPPGEDTTLCAFSSCARFSGKFRLTAGRGESALRLAAVIDTEGLALQPGEEWRLEELLLRTDADRTRLLGELADRLRMHHPPLATALQKPDRRAAPPTGWCSWYCFGPDVTARQVLDNLETIASRLPALTYVQIDDGYQSAMGDWLTTGKAFGGNVRAVLDQIRGRGFQPAIWVAPFVAEAASAVFMEHPDWFIAGSDGAPLRSDRVTFGGWRRGPWYVLDGTHPEVQRHFERLFRTMRTEWGCTYFKLDANFWGAMHGGTFHDRRATRVEAYRRGMQAISRGAGDAFLLGCNHPIWPSLGLIHGSRSSNDIKRSWDRVMTTARQNLSRNWQNGRLWWNDPDAVVLAGELSDSECQFHATAIYASGGMVLSGDDLSTIPAARAAMLRKLLPPTGVAAEFEDQSLRVGHVALADARMICLFNWDDAPLTVTARLPRAVTVTDHWTGESLGRRESSLSIEMAPRSARLLRTA
jgi:alpha-galactosidase